LTIVGKQMISLGLLFGSKTIEEQSLIIHPTLRQPVIILKARWWFNCMSATWAIYAVWPGYHSIDFLKGKAWIIFGNLCLSECSITVHKW
jgi:hypothetical protein